ncbi:hypothetical protein SESBI_09776 [Sesbania bispinosa]|nr:hypothetical protein SESBI_09776 [Sesbania bispinosa]
MLAHSLQRKYMFLICNAILAFLAKTSLFTSSSPPISSFDFDFQPSNLSQTTTKTPVSEEELQQVKRQQEEYYHEQVSQADEGEEQGALLLTETKGRQNEAFIAELGEEEEEVMDQDTTEDDELANTDELNRKFEEFIRKMKEEMRIQAQRQTIAV